MQKLLKVPRAPAARPRVPAQSSTALASIVRAARAAVPGIDHVGISVVRPDGSIETQAMTGQLVWELDGIQSDCVDYPVRDLEHQPQLVVERLADEKRWADYVAAALEAGLRAQLSLRVYENEASFGVLNLYATNSDTVDAAAPRTAETFARDAAAAMGHRQD